MCAIFTFSYAAFTDAVMAQIKEDAKRNCDGNALLLYNKHGHTTILRTMDLGLVETTLKNYDWSRMFLHMRKATKGTVDLRNTHGWETKGVYYMHNGRIDAEIAKNFPVDTMAIGEWLKQGPMRAMKELFSETYANVMLIDTTMNLYLVHRSFTGTLFTDGKGNYSTSRINDVTTTSVPDWTQSSHEIKCEKKEPVKVERKSVWEKIADGRFRYVGNGSMQDAEAWNDPTGPMLFQGANYIDYNFRVIDHVNRIVYKAATQEEADQARGFRYGSQSRSATRPAQEVIDVPKHPAAVTPTHGSSASPTVSNSTGAPKTDSEEVRAATENKFVQPTSQDIINAVAGRPTPATVIRRRAGTPDLSLVADAALVASGEGA